jgi:hypothetical protein
MIRNLTSHPVRLYAHDAPDVVGLDVRPEEVIPVHGPPARLMMVERTQAEVAHHYPAEGSGPWGADTGNGVIGLVPVEYGHATGLPAPDGGWFLVSRALALALPERTDLLVPYREVRDGSGTVVGCRALARPLPRALIRNLLAPYTSPPPEGASPGGYEAGFDDGVRYVQTGETPR